jgi:hypothetical protein
MTRPNNFEIDFNEQLDLRDQSKIDFLMNEQELSYAEYLRQADEYEIDPQPVPHIHTPHDEKVSRCYWTTRISHGGGITLAATWAALTASGRPIIASVLAVVMYSVLAILTDFVIFSFWPRKTFFERFKRLSGIPYPIALLSGLAILSERFASGDLASLLATIDPYAWLAAEASCLWLGAVAITGQDRYAWSRKLKTAYDTIGAEIEKLKHGIEHRATSARLNNVSRSQNTSPSDAGRGGKNVMALLLLSALVLPFRATACETIITDQTGSLANQTLVDQRLVKSVAKAVSNCITVIPVSAHVFSAQAYDLVFEKTHPVLFEGIKTAIDQKRAVEAEKKLNAIFGAPPLQAAACTSVSDMLILALAKGRSLLITDGEHTCPTPPPHLQGSGYVAVVLVRSKGAGGNDDAIFQKRRSWILHLLPSAHVFPEFQLEEAVQELFSHSSDLLKTLNTTYTNN